MTTIHAPATEEFVIDARTFEPKRRPPVGEGAKVVEAPSTEPADPSGIVSQGRHAGIALGK